MLESASGLGPLQTELSRPRAQTCPAPCEEVSQRRQKQSQRRQKQQMSTPPRPGPGLVGCMSCPGPQSTAGPGGIPWAWPGPACGPTGCGSGRRFRVVCRRASARRQTTRKCRKARYRQLIRPGRRGRQSGKFESHTSGWRSGSKAKVEFTAMC